MMKSSDESHEAGVKPAGPMARPLDLSQVMTRTRNMLNPELVVTWDSYLGKFSALGSRLLTQLAVDLGKGAQPPEFALSDLGADSTDLAAQPVIERGPNTVRIQWRTKDEPTRIDVTKLFNTGRIVVPHGQRGYIPLARRPVPGLTGDALVLLISQIRYAPVEKGVSRKKTSAGDAGTTAGGPTPEATGAHPSGGQPTGADPTGAHPTDAHPTNAHPTNAHPTDAHPTGAHPTDAHPTDAHPTNAHPTNAHPTNAHPTNAHPTAQPTGADPTGARPTGAHPSAHSAEHPLQGHQGESGDSGQNAAEADSE